jgi:SpoVK/Ycf46/Vps4 family AAA+-type ATPase
MRRELQAITSVQRATPGCLAPSGPRLTSVPLERVGAESGPEVEPELGQGDEDPERPRITLADVGGLEEVKARLDAAFLAPLRNPELRRY